MKIALLLTGHARWSEGMIAAYDLICGSKDQVTFLNFNDKPQPLETYQQNLRSITTKFLESYDEVWILTDLVGGYPFQQSALLSMEIPKTRVFGGVNLSFLVQLDGEKNNIPENNTLEFINELLEESRLALDFFIMPKTVINEVSSEDGI